MNRPPKDARPRMRLVSWKPLRKNALRGFATVRLPNSLKLIDCPVSVSNGKAWATLPSKPVIDRDGRHTQVNGKGQYTPVAEWPSKEINTKFSEAIVELVRQARPDDLGEVLR